MTISSQDRPASGTGAAGTAAAGRYLPADRLGLICLPCRIGLVLGHHVPDRSGAGVISRDTGFAHDDRRAGVALWRFVTDHAADPLRVVREGGQHVDDGTPIPADIRLIEPDCVKFLARDGYDYTAAAPDDLIVSEYIEGWPDQPALADVRGPRSYPTLHPHPLHSAGRDAHQRPTIRPGIAAPGTRDRAVHITDQQQAPWLTYFLAYDDQRDRWVLYGIDTLGSPSYESIDTDDLDATDVDEEHRWAADHLHEGHDADRGFVTEWRPVVLQSEPGWVPLFDDTDRRLLPWNDLAPQTGSRHPDAAARNHDPDSVSNAASRPQVDAGSTPRLRRTGDAIAVGGRPA